MGRASREWLRAGEWSVHHRGRRWSGEGSAQSYVASLNVSNGCGEAGRWCFRDYEARLFFRVNWEDQKLYITSTIVRNTFLLASSGNRRFHRYSRQHPGHDLRAELHALPELGSSAEERWRHHREPDIRSCHRVRDGQRFRGVRIGGRSTARSQAACTSISGSGVGLWAIRSVSRWC